MHYPPNDVTSTILDKGLKQRLATLVQVNGKRGFQNSVQGYRRLRKPRQGSSMSRRGEGGGELLVKEHGLKSRREGQEYLFWGLCLYAYR